LATERPVVSGLGGDGEDNYGDGLTMAAKMVMECKYSEPAMEHGGETWRGGGGGDGRIMQDLLSSWQIRILE
jgi:hypothetical protein